MVKVFWCALFVAQVATTTAFCQNISTDTIDNLSYKPKLNSLGFSASGDLLQVDSLSYSKPSRLKSWIQISPEKSVLTARSIVIPSAMIAYGAFTLTSKDLKRVNLAVKNKLWEDRNEGNGKRLHIDNFTLVAPALTVYALNIAGVKGKNNLVDASIIYGMSHLIGQVLIVSNVKKLTNTMRPDSSNRLSFPSGHTAQAFISAEFLRREYKDVSPWIGAAGYAVAVGTGFLRMYNNKHWLNDVIAGAGVGILSTHISYWLYPKIKNTFLGKWRGSTIVAPTYQNRAIGVGMIHQF
jgi:membrane-associated phospholipid phosphatase